MAVESENTKDNKVVNETNVDVVEIKNTISGIASELGRYYKEKNKIIKNINSMLEKENELLREKITLISNRLEEFEMAVEELITNKVLIENLKVPQINFAEQLKLMFDCPVPILDEEIERLREKNKKALSGESSGCFTSSEI